MESVWVSDAELAAGLGLLVAELERSRPPNIMTAKVTTASPGEVRQPTLLLHLTDAGGGFQVSVNPAWSTELVLQFIPKMSKRRRTIRRREGNPFGISDSMVGVWSEVLLERERNPARPKLEL